MARTGSWLNLLVALALVAVALPAAAQCLASENRYGIVDLGTFGGTFSAASDLDDRGRVVGAAWTAGSQMHPFLWEDGSLIDLGTLGGPSGSSAGGINGLGQITGQADNASNVRRAFLWDDYVMTELPPLAGGEGRGFDINDAGQIVGISHASSGYQHGFLYDSITEEIIDLGTALPGDNTSYANAINVWGQIAAWSGPGNGVAGAKAYLYQGGGWLPLGTLGGTRSVGYGLDDAGRIVGWSDVAGDVTSRAFLWEGGVMTDLGTLGGPTSTAAGVHESGPVVGWSDVVGATESQHAFVYAGGEMADLNQLIPAGSGWELTFAVAVNASGQIAGRGVVAGENHAYLATPAAASVDDLSELVESLQLPGGTATSLVVKLNRARAALESCSPDAACAPLGAFINEVEAQSGKKLSTEDADALLAAAAEIQAALSCP